MSACDPKLTEPLKPSFKAAEENALGAPKIKRLIYSLYMLKNPEGGWFVETDRDPLRIPNPGEKARIETFVVGHNIEEGERLQWIVEGDIYKASYLLPDNENSGESESGLLISETVVPGFEFSDHNFMPANALHELVSARHAEEIQWLQSSN